MAAIVTAEACWWAACWKAGLAPPPLLLTYLTLAFVALAAALTLRLALVPGRPRARWPGVLTGTLLVGLGASLFLPLKYAIPGQVGFWLDAPLAAAERALFGGDPWQRLQLMLGWALVPIDRIYGLWLPTQLLALFAVMLEPPSALKSRALIVYGLAWFALGVVAATSLSSVGPIFYDRVFGQTQFTTLNEMLRTNGAWMTVVESDSMWASFATSRPGAVAGISAMPSLHVAMSFWIFLVARALAPRAAPFALGYAFLIWIGSVQLGWHYVADGLVGALGVAAIWAAVTAMATRPGSTRAECEASLTRLRPLLLNPDD